MSDLTQLEIQRPDKPASRFDIVPGVYTVGSDEDCGISLPHEQVEGRHAIITIRDGDCWLEDLDGASGTYVEGERVNGRSSVTPGQEIKIGPFVLVFIRPTPLPVQESVPEPEPESKPPAPVTPAAKETASPTVTQTPDPVPTVPPTHPAMMNPLTAQKRSIKQQIHKELVERMDIKRLSASHINKDELEKKALTTIEGIVAEVAGKLPPGIEPATLVKEICDEALKLGPLEAFLDDPAITEIMVNGPNQVYVETAGKLVLTDQTFMNDASVLAIIERIVSPIGRRIDESQPYVDARLQDGSRVNAVIHPLSLIGPCLTIRKFSKVPFTDQDLINFGTMTPQIAEFVKTCILLRKNLVISGGTGSGKTSLLNVFSCYIPETDRILTIEDAAELRLTQAHVVRLEARPPNIEGKGAIPIRDLVRNALRMRPDRIVVGECRGGEALDMLQAMNTGHDGSLTTVHANSPRDVISRLETMVLMAGMDLPVRAIREQVASAVQLIVHESRFSDGTRKVTKVTEIVGLEGSQITMQDIFEYVQKGVDEDGKVVGYYRPTGSVPTFMEEVASRGLTIDRSMFDPQSVSQET